MCFFFFFYLIISLGLALWMCLVNWLTNFTEINNSVSPGHRREEKSTEIWFYGNKLLISTSENNRQCMYL